MTPWGIVNRDGLHASRAAPPGLEVGAGVPSGPVASLRRTVGDRGRLATAENLPRQPNTCQVIGCLVPVTFDADTTPLLQNGTTLKINATAADTMQPISFSISLNGFGGALARTADLSAD